MSIYMPDYAVAQNAIGVLEIVNSIRKRRLRLIFESWSVLKCLIYSMSKLRLLHTAFVYTGVGDQELWTRSANGAITVS